MLVDLIKNKSWLGTAVNFEDLKTACPHFFQNRFCPLFVFFKAISDDGGLVLDPPDKFTAAEGAI